MIYNDLNWKDRLGAELSCGIARNISEKQFPRFWLEWLMGDEAWGSLGIDLAINSVRQSLGDVSSLSVPAAPVLNLTFKSTTIN